MALPYIKKVIYITKTIIDYDEYDNVISQNIYYDKEVKYEKIQPKVCESKYYSYELLNSIKPINTSNINNTSNLHTSYTSSPTSSNTTSPLSSAPTSPILANDSFIIDMTNFYK